MDFQIIYQLVLATFLGALIGLEREYKKKGAGLQTYSLVCLGSCLFTIIAFSIVSVYKDYSKMVFDPIRVIQAIVIGIGFIGAGVIFQQSSGVVGLTTAAGLWTVSAIGTAVGMKFFSLSAFTTFLVLLVLSGMGSLEKKVFNKE